MATKHLIDQDCKKIVHVTSGLKTNVYSQRFKGYKDAPFDNGIDFDETMLILVILAKKRINHPKIVIKKP